MIFVIACAILVRSMDTLGCGSQDARGAESKGVSRGGGHSCFESRDLRVGECGFDGLSLWGVRSQLDKVMGGD